MLLSYSLLHLKRYKYILLEFMSFCCYIVIIYQIHQRIELKTTPIQLRNSACVTLLPLIIRQFVLLPGVLCNGELFMCNNLTVCCKVTNHNQQQKQTDAMA